MSGSGSGEGTPAAGDPDRTAVGRAGLVAGRPPLERTMRAWRIGSAVGPVVALVLANLVPLAGVLLFGWSLRTLLVVYWLENGIVGLWNVPKIVLARGAVTVSRSGVVESIGEPVGPAAKLILVPFFVVHYGMFWLVHGVFVVILSSLIGSGGGGVVGGSGSAPTGGPVGPFGSDPLGGVDVGGVALAALAMAVSHGLSFVLNYVGRREYERTSPVAQMFAVYGRVIVLHVTILVGAFGVFLLGSSVPLLVTLVVLKALLDLGLHAREHAATAG